MLQFSIRIKGVPAIRLLDHSISNTLITRLYGKYICITCQSTLIENGIMNL